MTGDIVQELQKVLATLESLGLLLVSDRAFPSVAGLVASEPVRGSWWSHPQSHTIFAVNEMLEDHHDVLITKLVNGKVTFVHRKLWQHVYTIGTAREDWQLANLSKAGKTLLKKVEHETSIVTDKVGVIGGKKAGDVARELEISMLIHAEQFHSESGAHSKRIETWDSWAKRVSFKARRGDQKSARLFFENRVSQLNNKFGSGAKLPWQV